MVGRGLDNDLWYRSLSSEGVLSEWRQLNPPFLDVPAAFPTEEYPVRLEVRGEPALAVRGNDVYMVVLGASTPYSGRDDLHLYFIRSTDGGHTWTSMTDIGGTAFFSPAVVVRDNNTIDVFVRNASGGISRKTLDQNGWSDWIPLGGCVRSGIAATSRGDGRVDLAVTGCNDAIWHGVIQGSENSVSWEQVGEGSFTSGTPAIVWDSSSGVLHIFARRRAGHDIVRTRYSGGWTPWESLGGCTKRGVSAAARPSDFATPEGAIDVMILGCMEHGRVSMDSQSEDALWYRTVSP